MLLMDPAANFQEEPPRHRRRTAVIALAGGILLAVIVLVAGLFAATGLWKWGSKPTRDQFGQMHAAFGSVHLSPDYKLLFRQDSGAAGLLGGDQGPEELRIYRLSAVPNAPTSLQNALRAAGFTVRRPYKCGFGAVRGPVFLSVLYYRRDPRGLVNGGFDSYGQGCPTQSWGTAYTWIAISYAGDASPQ